MVTKALLAMALLGAQAGEIPGGSARLEMSVKGDVLEVFTYKPQSYRGERMIVVLHGTLRNADDYRDNAREMGERFGALIVSPKFDQERFPSLRYQRGGITDAQGRARAEADWTYSYLPELVRRVRSMERRPMPYTIIGHSAGGQFLVRMAAFFDSGAERIVAANAGSNLFPTREAPFGYGFGGLPAELSGDDVLRRYLAAPLTLYLGSGDCVPDEHFDMSAEAMKQGPGRYQRNLACYEAARALAEERGWPFNWRLVIARGVGHDHKAMFDHPQADLALYGRFWPFRR
jgi:pimeloyl-ACP methyl ester carboxylesterase